MPVVGFTAKDPDPLGRCVNHADILDVELCDLKVLEAFEEGRDAAALARLFAGRNPLLDPAVDDIVALPVRDFWIDVSRDRVRNLSDRGCHINMLPRTGR